MSEDGSPYSLDQLGEMLDREMAKGPSPLLSHWLAKLKTAHARMSAKITGVEELIGKVVHMNDKTSQTPAMWEDLGLEEVGLERDPPIPTSYSPCVYGGEYSDALYIRNILNCREEIMRTGRTYSSPSEHCPVMQARPAKQFYTEDHFPGDSKEDTAKVEDAWSKINGDWADIYFGLEERDRARYDHYARYKLAHSSL